MHQLTKDPSQILHPAHDTPSSPQRTMSPPELTRYLDYSSEMLSLTAKVAAFYAQGSIDTQVVDAVNDLERLTTNLSQKIWQKITIVQTSPVTTAMAPSPTSPVAGGHGGDALSAAPPAPLAKVLMAKS